MHSSSSSLIYPFINIIINHHFTYHHHHYSCIHVSSSFILSLIIIIHLSTHHYTSTCLYRIVSLKVQKEIVYQWSVWKRYSDFEMLHTLLKKSLGSVDDVDNVVVNFMPGDDDEVYDDSSYICMMMKLMLVMILEVMFIMC